MIEDKKEGLLFAPGNIHELAECIDRIWSEPGLAGSLSEHARIRGRKNHDPEVNMERLLEIYREIAGGRR